MNPLATILAAGQAALAQSDAEEAVRSGRDALDRWYGYPWYDAQTDGLRRVDVREPSSWDWSAGSRDGWDWSWLPSFEWPSTLLGWLAWIAAIALCILLLVLLYRAYRRWAARWDDSDDEADTAQSAEDHGQRVEALPFPVRQPRGSLRDAARGAYQQGNYAEAIVYLFSYQLVELDKHHCIQLTKGKTNRQYLREVGARTAIRDLLGQTMVAFEDVFFGNHAIDRARFDRCWSRLDQFESLLAEATA